MDLRVLLDRIPTHSATNAVYTIEKGQVVRRTYADVQASVLAVSIRLDRAGVQAGMRVGIRAPNSYDWMIHDLALIRLRAVSVAFTADFQDASGAELCRRYDLALMLVGADAPPGEVGDRVFRMGDPHPQARAPAAVAPDAEFDRPGLIFSSGSAGGIKGMVLNRRGIEASIDGFTTAIMPAPDDRLLLFLPMSNFQQRLMYYAALWYGFDLIVVEPVHLFRALQDLAPTILIAPPAFYEAVENRVRNLPPWKRRLAMGMGAAVRMLPRRARRRAAAKIFASVHRALGGRMRVMVTGMAPIRRRTLDVFETMGLPLFETYGLIESGSVSLNLPGAYRVGSVGKPLPGVRVDLAPDGEIRVARDHPITTGYFECAEGEQERTYRDGAVATGDIGRFDTDGYLHLVGRKKEIIVTSGGEKVHPAVIEADIGACADVVRAVVMRRTAAADLGAVVVVADPADSSAIARIEAFVEQLNRQHWRNVSVGKLAFTDIVFSQENGLLRPNLKLDRARIADRFAAAVENA